MRTINRAYIAFAVSASNTRHSFNVLQCFALPKIARFLKNPALEIVILGGRCPICVDHKWMHIHDLKITSLRLYSKNIREMPNSLHPRMITWNYCAFNEYMKLQPTDTYRNATNTDKHSKILLAIKIGNIKAGYKMQEHAVNVGRKC